MGTTFKQLYNKLELACDVVPVTVAKESINEALRDIYDSTDWGFLWKETYFRTPVVISGHAAVIKYGTTITLDTATKTLVNALTVDEVPIEERQIKFFGTTKVDRVFYYNIKSYDSGTGIITLDDEKPFLDDTNANIQIEIFKVYYTAPFILINNEPVIDFRRFAYIASPFYQRYLILNRTLDEINRFDPSRTYGMNGEPRYFIPFGINADGNQLYEIYPVPRNERVYRIKYLRNGIPLSRDTDQLPNNILSTELVLSRAKQIAYEWVIANQQKLGIKSVTGYVNMLAKLDNRNSTSSYPRLLERAQARDEELFPKAFAGDFAPYNFYDDLLYDGYDMSLPHDRFGETLVIDASA